ncbi:hypothetical protein PACTADRAFT_34685 [Pachysolen tannophilus NRRL Y-2460]|uniref:Uncharacterized protein n=1 Tax=Pachysolen tannophilus NRRL Y-2460 TaxID=669874 RepID=A0A1E4TT60_PACTA|nr:hypothetical protein PACTADRAFT_34685 [Pachysolen tannophilus NRRL Y-2460]
MSSFDLESFFVSIHNYLKLPAKDCELNLSNFLSLSNLNDVKIASLQKDLNSNNGLNDEVLLNKIESQEFLGNKYNNFNRLILSYLKFVQNFNPWSILQSIDIILAYFKNLSKCFENKELIKLFQQTLIRLTNFLIPLLVKIDGKLLMINKNYKKFCRLEYLTELLLSIFTKLIISKTVIDENVISFVAIKLMKIYFLIDKPKLCNNILTNIKNLNIKFNNLTKSNKINYRFLIGKFYLFQNDLIKSFDEFYWCFNNLNIYTCPAKNVLIILKYLLPCAILIGKFPNLQEFSILLQKFNNDKIQNLLLFYLPITKYVKNGDFQKFNNYLIQHDHFMKNEKLSILFIQRIRIIILRNLVYKVYLNCRDLTRNTLSFDSIKTGLTVSLLNDNLDETYYAYKIFLPSTFQNTEMIDDLIVENVLVSLIDQKLIKGHIFSRLKLIKFASSIAFPSVYSVNREKF